MQVNDLKAAFSLAYVRAVAHAAGYFAQEGTREFDSDGIDLMLLSRGPGGSVRSPRLDVQVKATAAAIEGDPFPFDLKTKNYDELRSTDLQVPRILVVVVVPEDANRWVEATEEELVLRHCGYWISLHGRPETQNTATVRVVIPRSSCFHVEQVRGIMGRIRDGGLP
jgi:hypothetical protein